MALSQFLQFSGLTSLKIQTSECADTRTADPVGDPEITLQIEHMLLEVMKRLRTIMIANYCFTRRLEELALAQMIPDHAWTQLELPGDALPKLRHLECSSAQAAALFGVL